MNVAIALSISFFIPLGFLYLIRKLDLFGTGKFHYNFATILWGTIAYAFAALINSTLLKSQLISYDQVLRIVAPIVEEILKSLVLFYLVRRADFNYVVDGAVYGFGAGISFAVMENYEYVTHQPEIAISLALLRVFSTNLIHAASSGLVGSALALGRTERGSRWIFFTAGGLAIATIFHMRFNAMVIDGAFLPIAILVGMLGTALIAVIIKRGLKIQQTWIGETLGMADRVTHSEATAVQRIQSLENMLSPITKQFGPQKASQTEALLILQAELGIKRKILEKTRDEKLLSKTQTEVQRITNEMDTLRKAIGPYCMLFVRTVYLESGSTLWDAIYQRVAAESTGEAGGGLWSRLEGRLKESKKQGTDHEQ